MLDIQQIMSGEMPVGTVVAEGEYELTRDMLVRYAGASGDFNPIHYRDDIASEVGLDGVIAHGMLTMGVAFNPVFDWVGDPSRIQSYQVRFTRPIPVDRKVSSLVSVSASLAQLDLEHERVRIDVSCVFEGRTVLGKAQAWVRLS